MDFYVGFSEGSLNIGQHFVKLWTVFWLAIYVGVGDRNDVNQDNVQWSPKSSNYQWTAKSIRLLFNYTVLDMYACCSNHLSKELIYGRVPSKSAVSTRTSVLLQIWWKALPCALWTNANYVVRFCGSWKPLSLWLLLCSMT